MSTSMTLSAFNSIHKSNQQHTKLFKRPSN